MRHGSLFSGIGGFDLAAEWMGWENVFHCEWKEFNQRVLKYYWPEAISYVDITKSDFTIHRGGIDILTGGFPCQPYSVAGKRKGTEDSRHLWPEMLRAIREIQPSYVVGENVGGLVSWNGGLVFDQVQADLEAEGYEVQPFILPACAVNAPHRRDRVWFIAYSKSVSRINGTRNEEHITQEVQKERPDESFIVANAESLRINRAQELKDGDRQGGEWRGCNADNVSKVSRQDGNTDATNPNNERQQERNNARITERQGRIDRIFSSPENWDNFPTQSPICNGDDGISARLVSITFPKWRNESIMAGGNAIVPQVALKIFKAIEDSMIFKQG
jgi:DNA (cytosine-5)-methyltransferase 1